MYYDGYGINEDCTSPNAPLCWVHRDNILGMGTCTTCVMGAGNTPGAESMTELFVRPVGPGGADIQLERQRGAVPGRPHHGDKRHNMRGRRRAPPHLRATTSSAGTAGSSSSPRRGPAAASSAPCRRTESTWTTSWAWSRPRTTRATSWWDPTAGSSASATHRSSGRSRAWASPRDPSPGSCPPAQTAATSWSGRTAGCSASATPRSLGRSPVRASSRQHHRDRRDPVGERLLAGGRDRHRLRLRCGKAARLGHRLRLAGLGHRRDPRRRRLLDRDPERHRARLRRRQNFGTFPSSGVSPARPVIGIVPHRRHRRLLADRSGRRGVHLRRRRPMSARCRASQSMCPTSSGRCRRRRDHNVRPTLGSTAGPVRLTTGDVPAVAATVASSTVPRPGPPCADRGSPARRQPGPRRTWRGCWPCGVRPSSPAHPPPAIGEHRGGGQVSTVVVMSGTASLPAVEFCTPMATARRR